MATLRLIQATDMNALSDMTNFSGSYSTSEIDLTTEPAFSGTTVQCLGSFQFVSEFHLSGTGGCPF